MHLPKPLFLALIALVAALAVPGAASSATRPCWKDLVDDYWADFRVDKIYPVSCYRDAMDALPRDVEEYTDAQDDLRSALLAAIRDERGDGGFNREPEDEEGGGETVAPPIDDQGGGGFFREVLDKIGPKNADSVPVPLLILAGIAALLFGAAGVSYGARWLQERQAHAATNDPT